MTGLSRVFGNIVPQAISVYTRVRLYKCRPICAHVIFASADIWTVKLTDSVFGDCRYNFRRM